MIKSWHIFVLFVLMLASFVCLYIEFWKPRCQKPFVELGDSCYFFSTYKQQPRYEYYKVSYKGRLYSVPAELDWLNASFACETLDVNARLVSLESVEEIFYLADYMRPYVLTASHPRFWSSGHRGNLGTVELDLASMNNFYWGLEPHPMDSTNFIVTNANSIKGEPNGICLYIEFPVNGLFMYSADCKEKKPYVCEISLT